MKCFYHPQTDAVAICKNCSKGLCFECAVDVGNGVACKGKCESEVQAVNEMIQRGIQNGKRTKDFTVSYYKRLAIIYSLVGLSILTFGALLWENGKGIVFIPAGLVCLLFAFHYFSTLKKYSGKKINF